MESTINLKLLWILVKRKLHYVIISAILLAAIFFSVSSFVLTKQYSSSVSLYVSNVSSNIVIDSDRIQSADLNASIYLARSCEVLFKEQAFLSSLASRLDGRISAGRLNSAVTVSAFTNTQIVKITAKTPSAELSADICNEIALMADDLIKAVVGNAASAMTPPGTIIKPSVKQSSPNVMKNTILGAFLGAAAVVGIIFLAFILDNTVKEEEDVRIHLDIPVLGEIPSLQEKSARRVKKNG